MRALIISSAAGNREGDSTEAPAPTKNVSFSSSDINSLIFRLDFFPKTKGNVITVKIKMKCYYKDNRYLPKKIFNKMKKSIVNCKANRNLVIEYGAKHNFHSEFLVIFEMGRNRKGGDHNGFGV